MENKDLLQAHVKTSCMVKIYHAGDLFCRQLIIPGISDLSADPHKALYK